MATRALGYGRISVQTDESTSIERQRELYVATCEQRGWEAAGWHEDVDVSATKKRLDRPGLDDLRDALAADPSINVVVVWRLDRLARSVQDLTTLVEEFDSHDVALVSATEPFDMTTPTGRLLLQLL